MGFSKEHLQQACSFVCPSWLHGLLCRYYSWKRCTSRDVCSSGKEKDDESLSHTLWLLCGLRSSNCFLSKPDKPFLIASFKPGLSLCSTSATAGTTACTFSIWFAAFLLPTNCSSLSQAGLVGMPNSQCWASQRIRWLFTKSTHLSVQKYFKCCEA